MDNESGDRKKERDAVFKYFISRKDILIPLLQFAVERLRGPEMKEKLENALEKEEGGNRIRCLNTESSSLSNGRIIYDSLFDVDLPDGDGFMLRVDVEEQLYGTTAYPLEARAAYYLGRMMSDQKNTDFRRRHEIREHLFLKENERVGRKVLLVDDIVTTGETLKSCSDILTEAGHEVCILTLCYNKRFL